MHATSDIDNKRSALGVPCVPKVGTKVGVSFLPCTPTSDSATFRRCRSVAMPATPGMNRETGQLPWRGAPPSEGGQGDEWAAYVVLDTYDEDVPRDRLRGASPMATECP